MPRTYPSTLAELKSRWPYWQSSSFENCLGLEELKWSGSKWGEKHLQACRVLVKKKQLPDLLLKSLRNVDESEYMELFESLRSIKQQDLSSMPRSELRKKGGVFGSFFIHLADLMQVHIPKQTASQDRTRRHIQHLTKPGFVTGEGLSSPISSSHSQPQTVSSPSSEYQPDEKISIDEDVHVDRTKSEILTAQMATEFLSVTVDLCQAECPKRLVVTSAPSTYKVKNRFLDCQCRDDGCLMWQSEPDSCDLSSNCIIEVKPRVVKCSIDKEGDPEVNTCVLGQQVCEILGAFLQQVPEDGTIAEEFQSLKTPHVFLISIQQTFFTLLHVEFNQAYLHFFEDAPTTDSSGLKVIQSQSYDLANEDGRLDAAKLIIALCKVLAKIQKEHNDSEDQKGDTQSEDQKDDTESEDQKEDTDSEDQKEEQELPSYKTRKY